MTHPNDHDGPRRDPTAAKQRALDAARRSRDKAEHIRSESAPKADQAVTTTRHVAEKAEPTVPGRVTDSSRQIAEITARSPAVPVAAVAVLAGVAVWLIVRWRR
jgi:hypothetical protein